MKQLTTKTYFLLAFGTLFLHSPQLSLAQDIRGGFNQVLQYVQEGNHEAASILLYRLVQTNDDAEKAKMQYFLGLSFLELELNQAAAYQFVEVIRQGRSEYMTKSLEKLGLVADLLGDPDILNFALLQYQGKNFPPSQKDMLFFRQGESLLQDKRYGEAAGRFARVSRGSRYYNSAKYKQGLAHAYEGKTGSALKSFYYLSKSVGEDPLQSEKVLADLSMARVYYQRKIWEKSIRKYREVPKDSKYWYEALYEETWAYLMSGQFRSALSNFQSLHSPFFENVFNPESLILQGIVYLYICDYEDVDKVVNSFSTIYTPVRKSLQQLLDRASSPLDFFMLFNGYAQAKAQKKDYVGELPVKVAEFLMKDERLRRSYIYLYRLQQQKSKMASYSEIWRRSAPARYAQQAIDRRIRRVETSIGEFIQAEFSTLLKNLKGYFDQSSFLRFEVINEKKKKLKEKIAGKTVESSQSANISEDRSFYIQNGYEYWPSSGERWLDELGNYHFLGRRSCNE